MLMMSARGIEFISSAICPVGMRTSWSESKRGIGQTNSNTYYRRTLYPADSYRALDDCNKQMHVYLICNNTSAWHGGLGSPTLRKWSKRRVCRRPMPREEMPAEQLLRWVGLWFLLMFTFTDQCWWIFEGSLEAKLPTIWTVEKQRWEESEEKRSEERGRCAKR